MGKRRFPPPWAFILHLCCFFAYLESVPVPRFSSTPQGLLSPSSLSSPSRRSGTAARHLLSQAGPRPLGSSGSKANLAETLDGPQSPPGRSRSTAEGYCCNLLCSLTSFSQIRSGQSKEMVNSARVCFFIMEGTSQASKNIPSLWLHSLLVAFRAESENSSLYIQSLLIQF